MMKRNGYKSDLDGLTEFTREGADNDLHIVTKGYGGRLSLQVTDGAKAFRSVAVSMEEDQVRMLIDDLQKWLASAAPTTVKLVRGGK